MLARVADSMFWMSAYIERAENIARFIYVNINSLLEEVVNVKDEHWHSLIAATGDAKEYYRRFEIAKEENILKFLILDKSYVNSIVSIVGFARENARAIRDSISSEMWEHLNKFYHQVQKYNKKKVIDNYHQLLTEVKTGCQLFNALTDATMSHEEGWYFAQIGRMLERADKTSRILDVKYHLLSRRRDELLIPTKLIEWAALLSSVGALEMYRKKHHKLNPQKIVEFLLFDEYFPRSLKYCLNRTYDAFNYLNKHNPRHKEILFEVDKINNGVLDLSCRYEDDELHAFIDDIQKQINIIFKMTNENIFAISSVS